MTCCGYCIESNCKLLLVLDDCRKQLTLLVTSTQPCCYYCNTYNTLFLVTMSFSMNKLRTIPSLCTHPALAAATYFRILFNWPIFFVLLQHRTSPHKTKSFGFMQQVLQALCPSSHPTNRYKALKVIQVKKRNNY